MQRRCIDTDISAARRRTLPGSRLLPRPEALRQFVRERLRSTKTPEQIVYRPALPYTETGKLLRRALKLELSKTASAPGG